MSGNGSDESIGHGFATKDDIRDLGGRIDKLDQRLWMFMGAILVFTLGVVWKGL